VILGQVGKHIGFEASGFTELMGQVPRELAPDVADKSNGLLREFPVLSFALIGLEQGDRDGTLRAYRQAGPVRSWSPLPALRLSCWAHGLPVAIDLHRTDDIAYLAGRFEPFRGRHVANGAGAGVYLGPVELQLGRAAAALGQLDAAVGDLETAAAICDAVGAPGLAVEASVELAAALGRRGMAGDAGRALALLDRAGPDAGRLGMTPFTRRIDQMRSRLLPAEPPPSALSRRELEWPEA